MNGGPSGPVTSVNGDRAVTAWGDWPAPSPVGLDASPAVPREASLHPTLTPPPVPPARATPAGRL